MKTNPGKLKSQRKPLRSTQNCLLQACNLIIAGLKKKYYDTRVHADFSKKGTETQLNALSFSDGRRIAGDAGKLEVQERECVFSFIEGCMDRCTG